MSHIFISYNQEDSDFAAVLMMHIEKAGFDTWMDKSRLRPGSDWSETIDKGIREAITMVVVMSPAAKASEYVTYEWSFAVGAGIPVIPAMYKDTVLHPRLGRYQYLNFTNPSVRPWDELVTEIKEIDKQRSLLLDNTIPAYIKQAVVAFDSPNPADREGAVRTLGGALSGDLSAKTAILAALDHPLLDVRAHASVQLIRNAQSMADSRIVSALGNGLDRTPPLLNENEVESAFIEAGLEELDLVIACVQSPVTSLRLMAIRSLGRLRHTRATETLATLLRDKAVIESAYAAIELIRNAQSMADPRIITALSAGLDSKPPWLVSGQIEKAFSEAGLGEIDLMIACLQSPVRSLQAIGIRQLGGLRDTRATKHLTALLLDKVVCELAVDALGKIGDKSATPDLLRLLDEPYDAHLILAAVRSLVSLGACPTVAQVAAVLHKTGSLGRLRPHDADTVNALTLSIAGQDFCGDDEEALMGELSSADAVVKASVAVVLGLSKSVRAVPTLCKLLRDGELAENQQRSWWATRIHNKFPKALLPNTVQMAALFGLYSIGTPEAVSAAEEHKAVLTRITMI
jgi:HEAT repeat protein